MDGFSDVGRQTAPSREQSQEMRVAIACLGGERRWEGSVRGLFGLIHRRFSIRSIGVFDKGVLRFTETLFFHDGETQQREWRLADGENGLKVEAPDVAHVKSSCRPEQNALKLVYKIKFRGVRFIYDDRFVLGPDNGVENLGHVSFAGVRVMTVTASSPERRGAGA